MEIKTKGNENEIILGDFNFTINKLDRDGGNKWQRIYRFRFNYVLSKLIEKNELEDIRRKENPDSSEFTHYNRISGTRSRIDGVCSDHYNTISIDRLPSKTKIGKDSWYFKNSFLWKPSSPQLQWICFFMENAQKKHPSASDWWQCTQSCFKENATNFSKNLTTQENIRISRLKKDYEAYTKKKILNQKLNQW